MKQTITAEKYNNIQTDTKQGWSLWRTAKSEERVEYLFSSCENDRMTANIMSEAMAALLSGMYIGFILSDATDEGVLAKNAMREISDAWPDARLLVRSSGVIFVAFSEESIEEEKIIELMKFIQEYQNIKLSFIGYQKQTPMEVRFAHLFDDEADILLTLNKQQDTLLSINMQRNTISDAEVWARMQNAWKKATQKKLP